LLFVIWLLVDRFNNNGSCGLPHPGLPDGIFLNPKFQFGQISEVLRIENFVPIWNIFWAFGIHRYVMVIG
jgi:hypothetical protein